MKISQVERLSKVSARTSMEPVSITKPAMPIINTTPPSKCMIA